MGCSGEKEKTLADKAFEENSKIEDKEKEQQDAQLEEKKKRRSTSSFANAATGTKWFYF